jgi:hypothetical protein
VAGAGAGEDDGEAGASDGETVAGEGDADCAALTLGRIVGVIGSAQAASVTAADQARNPRRDSGARTAAEGRGGDWSAFIGVAPA